MATNFHIAPPPKTVDGLLAVPVDISTIDAHFTFDGATSTATADATITYTVGPTGGNPIFDLRQTITAAWLDGAPFGPAQLAHHAFGTGSFTDLRVIQAVQAAGSVHTLRVQYGLAIPDSQLGGAYLPALDWSPGPRLRFVFGLSDLNRARYAEAWLPANLIFDQFSIALEITILNTLAAHTVLTNGAVTTVGPNHWQIAFPARFTALSPMLEVRASDTLDSATGTASLPVSAKTVTIEAWKPLGGGTVLATEINHIRDYLIANETDYGAYLHGTRYAAFFNGGGMEYEGGTTTAPSALRHETFHSWFARGMKPASQADGWWDEGFTTYHDAGATGSVPFDFTAPPIVLSSRDPWQRHTAGNAYGDGSAFWNGMAALLGVAPFNQLMAELYERYKGGSPVSTAMIEEHLLARSGNPTIVAAFHRFAFGLADPSPIPDLWMRDDPAHPGADAWNGPFWDSPDLWVRNNDDGGLGHQAPESGQDNWFQARVRNRSATGTARHFVVAFQARGFAGTEFVYPADFLPSVAATAGFELGPGETRIVTARWPRSQVPPAGTHTCVLAAVLTRSDLPVGGRHVWEHNNLAQKNLTVVDLLPDTWVLIPIVISNWIGRHGASFQLALAADKPRPALDVRLVHPRREFFKAAPVEATPFQPDGIGRRRSRLLDCGGRVGDPDDGAILTSDDPGRVVQRFPDSWEARMVDGDVLPVRVPPATQTVVGLRVGVPRGARAGSRQRIHLIQRTPRGVVLGGVAVDVRVRADDTADDHLTADRQPGGRRGDHRAAT
jgi:hypothetical protein